MYLIIQVNTLIFRQWHWERYFGSLRPGASFWIDLFQVLLIPNHYLEKISLELNIFFIFSFYLDKINDLYSHLNSCCQLFVQILNSQRLFGVYLFKLHFFSFEKLIIFKILFQFLSIKFLKIQKIPMNKQAFQTQTTIL